MNPILWLLHINLGWCGVTTSPVSTDLNQRLTSVLAQWKDIVPVSLRHVLYTLQSGQVEVGSALRGRL